jgi:signal transduction histidine kinase/CheY-like chemotaxis protein
MRIDNNNNHKHKEEGSSSSVTSPSFPFLFRKPTSPSVELQCQALLSNTSPCSSSSPFPSSSSSLPRAHPKPTHPKMSEIRTEFNYNSDKTFVFLEQTKFMTFGPFFQSLVGCSLLLCDPDGFIVEATNSAIELLLEASSPPSSSSASFVFPSTSLEELNHSLKFDREWVRGQHMDSFFRNESLDSSSTREEEEKGSFNFWSELAKKKGGAGHQLRLKLKRRKEDIETQVDRELELNFGVMYEDNNKGLEKNCIEEKVPEASGMFSKEVLGYSVFLREVRTPKVVGAEEHKRKTQHRIAQSSPPFHVRNRLRHYESMPSSPSALSGVCCTCSSSTLSPSSSASSSSSVFTASTQRVMMKGIQSTTDYSVLFLDSDSTVRSWNLGATLIHGWESTSLHQTKFPQLFLEKEVYSGRVQNALEVARREGRFNSEEEGLEFRLKSHRKVEKEKEHEEKEKEKIEEKENFFWGSVTLTSVRDEKKDGSLLGFICIIRDLTSRRQTLGNFESVIRDHQKALRERDQFLANISHELRTPMIAILGYSELLLQNQPQQPPQELYKVIHESSLALSNLLEEIFTWTRIQMGKLQLQPVDFDLISLLEDLPNSLQRSVRTPFDLVTPAPDMPSYSSSASASSPSSSRVFSSTPSSSLPLQLTLDISEELKDFLEKRRLIGDSQRLQQILLNLVSNAFKFTKEGEITLRVLSLPSPSSSSDNSSFSYSPTLPVLLRFICTDTGIGISQNDLPTLFQPFRQLDPSSTRSYGGLGLGLAIVKNLVEMMGGSISVESEGTGKGSSFSFDVQLLPGSRKNCSFSSPPASPACFVKALSDSSVSGAFIIPVSASSSSATTNSTSPSPSVSPSVSKAPLPALSLSTALSTSFPCSLNRVTSARYSPPLPTAPSMKRRGSLDVTSSSSSSSSSTTPELFLSPRERQPWVLIVEDNPISKAVLQRQLQRLGYTQVDAVNNGQEALVAHSKKQYDLILLDLQMPVLTGWQAAALIREKEVLESEEEEKEEEENQSQSDSDFEEETEDSGKEQEEMESEDEEAVSPFCDETEVAPPSRPRRRVSIVAITASDGADDREKCLKCGFDDLIFKPLTLQQLDTVLKKVTYGNGNNSAPDMPSPSPSRSASPSPVTSF